ncbi:MAG: hypothetical protein ACRDNS_23190 [Trebonia sp.]
MRSTLSEIQQSFVHAYMDEAGVVGVRVRELDGEMVLYVELEDAVGPVSLPEEFRGLPVRRAEGRRAVLAYR